MIMSASATPSPPKPVEVEMALPSDDAVGIGRKAEDNMDDVPEQPGEPQAAAATSTSTGRKCRLKPVFIFGTTALFIASVAVGVNTSRNKRAAVTVDTNTGGTTFEKSFTLAENVKAGPKKGTSTSYDASLLCGCQECEDVKDNVACGVQTDNCHTCEARIDWLQTSAGGSLSEDEACKLVGKYEFKPVCGPCYKCKTHKSASDTTVDFWCNNPSCTETIFNAPNSACDDSGCHSCKSRVTYLENVMSFNEKDACNKVTKEFPTECPCKYSTKKSA